MSYPTAELLGRVERRRRFSVEQKLAVLAEAMAPGANMSEVARRHGLVPTQVYKWRRLAELGVIGMPGASELPSFVAVEIAKDVPSLPAVIRESKPAAVSDAPRRRQRKKAGLIEIELAGGRRVRVDRDVDAAALGECWTRWRGDDPGSERRAGVAGGRPDRYEEGHEWASVAGAAGAGPRPACRRFVRLQGRQRRSN